MNPRAILGIESDLHPNFDSCIFIKTQTLFIPETHLTVPTCSGAQQTSHKEHFCEPAAEIDEQIVDVKKNKTFISTSRPFIKLPVLLLSYVNTVFNNQNMTTTTNRTNSKYSTTSKL